MHNPFEYFKHTSKHYIILALRSAGVHIDADMHTELDDAYDALEEYVHAVAAKTPGLVPVVDPPSNVRYYGDMRELTNEIRKQEAARKCYDGEGTA